MYKCSLPAIVTVVVALLTVNPHRVNATEQQRDAPVSFGQSCSELGTTSISKDQHSVSACLYNKSHALVWMPLSAQPYLAPSRAGTVQGVVSAEQRWQGWYAGVNAGLADTSTTDNRLNSIGTITLNKYGPTVGVTGGYNWVQNNGFFYGGEADINYLNNVQQSASASILNRSVWNGYSTVRGRVGLALDPALIFLTGGLALVDVSNELHSNSAFISPSYGYTNRYVHVGWSVGAGTEFAITNNISMVAQYLRLEMPASSQAYTDHIATNYKDILNNSANILRVGLNWHFD